MKEFSKEFSSLPQQLPFHEAIQSQQPLSVLESLLNEGHDINRADAEGNTPLHLAAMQNDLERIVWLVEYGADTQAENQYKQMPYKIAEEKGYTFYAKFLQPSEDQSSKIIVAALHADPTLRSLYCKGYTAMRTRHWAQAQSAFAQAYQLTENHQDVKGQILCLEQLTKIYLQQEKYAAAAKLSNAALAIYDKHFDLQTTNKLQKELNQTDQLISYPEDRTYLVNLCIQVEVDFIQKYLKKSYQNPEKLSQHHAKFRAYLKSLRRNIKNRLASNNYSSPEIMQYTTKFFVELVRQLLERQFGIKKQGLEIFKPNLMVVKSRLLK